jgi:uncharacterized protein with PIN domain
VIVVDTSALLAILLHEPEMTIFRDILAEAQRKFVSSVSLLETGIVIMNGAAGVTALKDFVDQAEIEIVRSTTHNMTSQSRPFRPSVKVVTPPASISAIALPMRSPKASTFRYSSKVTISRRPILSTQKTEPSSSRTTVSVLSS